MRAARLRGDRAACLALLVVIGATLVDDANGSEPLDGYSAAVAGALLENGRALADSSLQLRRQGRLEETISMYGDEYFQRYDRPTWARILTGHEIVFGVPVAWELSHLDLRMQPDGSVYAIVLFFSVESERGAALESFTFRKDYPLVVDHSIWPKQQSP